jgi:chaperonin GroEL
MSGKIIKTFENSIEQFKEVVTLFTDTVSSTLGPGGKTVIIHQDDAVVPHVTKDGVTVAESIHFSDKYKESIVSLLKESARKTAKDVGDGTTTSTLLSGTMISSGLEALPKLKNRRQFFAGMNSMCDHVVDYLEDSKRIIVDDKDAIKNIIKISSNNDEKIVELLGNIVDDIGPDGLINVEFADSNDLSIEIADGASIEGRSLTIDVGDCTMSDSYVLLVEGAISNVYDLEPVLRYLASIKGHSAIVIAKEFSETVTRTVRVNNSKGVLNMHLVEAEGFGINRMDILKDLSNITKAEVISTNGSTDKLLREFDSSMFGTASKVVVTPKSTTLLPNSDVLTANQVVIDSTIKSLKEAILNGLTDEGSIRNIKRRLSKYTKVATIRVGGNTEAEATETKDRVEDAVCAITAAVNGGIIPGAGSTLYIAACALEGLLENADDVDYIRGATVLLGACKQPIQKMLENAGFDVGSMPLKDLTDTQTIDINTGVIVDAYKSGIIDPVMSSKKAVVNAVTICKTLLDSSSVIIQEDEV